MTREETTANPACYRHPDRETLLACSRCGRPICSSCSTDATVGQRCPECLRVEGTQRVIPTGSRRSTTSVTLGIIVITVAFYLFTRGAAGETALRNLAQFNLAISEGEFWRLFTPVLLHANLTHILFNMWALWVLGPQNERGVGTGPFIGAYLASAGMGGAFAFLLGDPLDVAVGASGAIFGLFGIWLNWAVRRRNTAYGQALLRQIGFLLLLNAALPFIIRNIAWEAHLGGLVAGFVIGELWSRLSGPNTAVARVGVTVGVAGLAILMVYLPAFF